MYGYASYPQKPSPNRRQVGEALVMQGMQGGPGGGAPAAPAGPEGMGGMPMGGAPAPELATPAGVGDPAEAALRAEGGKYMGGSGQSGWGSGTPPGGPDTDPNPSAMAAAVGEALTRQGGGIMRDPNPNIDRDRRRRDALRLGISEFEADLMAQTGGL